MKLTKEKTIIGLGILLVLLPLTGFPRSWKTALTVLIGFAVVYMGVLLFRIARAGGEIKDKKETRTQTFTETA